MVKIDTVKWSQRFVLIVVTLIVLVVLVFMFNVIFTEGLLGMLKAIIGAAFIAVFFYAFWKGLHEEWDAIQGVDEELTAEMDPRIIQLESQLEAEKRNRREAEAFEETERMKS